MKSMSNIINRRNETPYFAILRSLFVAETLCRFSLGTADISSKATGGVQKRHCPLRPLSSVQCPVDTEYD